MADTVISIMIGYEMVKREPGIDSMAGQSRLDGWKAYSIIYIWGSLYRNDYNGMIQIRLPSDQINVRVMFEEIVKFILKIIMHIKMYGLNTGLKHVNNLNPFGYVTTTR